MTEAAQPAATQPGPISVAQAAQMFAEKRAGKTDVSAHASALGKRSAEARKERTTEAVQPTPEAEAGAPEQDDEAEAETLNEETASDGSSTETQPAAEKEPGEAQTIDLGDGVRVTLDEVRDGFMLKADHTRKTQALSEERKSFETDRKQRLELLDQVIVAGQQLLGQPRDPRALIEEFGADEGMKQYFAQVAQFENLGRVIQARQSEQAQHVEGLKQSTIKHLSEKHGDKAANLFSEAVQYVSSNTGTDARNVETMLAHPEAVQMVLDAKAYRELKAKETDVKRTIADKPKVVRPGVRVSAQGQAQSDAQNARAKLQKSGSLADAVAFLQAQRKAGGKG